MESFVFYGIWQVIQICWVCFRNLDSRVSILFLSKCDRSIAKKMIANAKFEKTLMTDAISNAVSSTNISATSSRGMLIKVMIINKFQNLILDNSIRQTMSMKKINQKVPI